MREISELIDQYEATQQDELTTGQCVAWLKRVKESADLAGRRLIDEVIEDLQMIGTITRDMVELVLGALESVAVAIELRPRVRLLGVPVTSA